MTATSIAAAELGGSSTMHDGVTVVVPVYNEAKVVGEVVVRLRQVFPRVVVVDDGSRDDSAEICARSGATVVRHAVNLGQGAALQTGITFALADPCTEYVVTFDADGQHRVEDAQALLAALEADPALDVALGSRFLDSTTKLSPLKSIVLRVAARQSNRAHGLELTDAHNGLRALRRRFARRLDITQSGMAHASELVAQMADTGAAYVEVPVTVLYTEYSKSKGQPLINGVNIVFDLLFRRL